MSRPTTTEYSLVCWFALVACLLLLASAGAQTNVPLDLAGANFYGGTASMFTVRLPLTLPPALFCTSFFFFRHSCFFTSPSRLLCDWATCKCIIGLSVFLCWLC
jgi:hypothetical protein